MANRSRFEVRWQDWAVAIALGAIMLLLAVLALVTWGGWSHQRDVARAMEPPPHDETPAHEPTPGAPGGERVRPRRPVRAAPGATGAGH